MEKIAIIGAGGFGREVQMLIEQINAQQPSFDLVGYFDDSIEKGTQVNGFEVLGTIAEINSYNERLGIALGLGSPAIKRKIVQSIDNPHIFYPTLIHPNAQIGFPHVTLGEGVILCANTILTINITLGDFVTLNLGCTVGHDSVLGNYSAFMPGCDIAGEVQIGSEVYGGMGSKIINQTKVGDGVVLGAGAVVVRDIEEKTLAVGMPAKSIKKL